MRGGFFRVLKRRFAGDFGAVAMRGWAVLQRNSGVFEWREGAARRFSARRTVSVLGAKKFLKIFKNRVKNRKIGV